MIRSCSSLLFWLGMTIASSVMLYHTSDRVTALDAELHKLNAQIDAEQQSLHVLKAEWVYLSSPARVEAEAKRHLGLQATATPRIAALENINDVVPMRDGIAAPTIKAAQATPPSAPVSLSPMPSSKEAAADAPHTERDRVLAALNAGRINDHMTMEHAKTAATPTDRIGALIGKLGLQP